MIGLVDGNNFFVSCERAMDPRLEGRPVAVLSNNDGCCVSRSNEFKALGIAMGTPYFRLKDRERTGELVFRSSNYELYGDMSRRIISILRSEAADVEQYSIDEAFVIPPAESFLVARFARPVREAYEAYGAALREKVLRWTGIPCGVGFAPTRTLAKIANHAAKKRPDGVFVMPADPAGSLAELPIEEVWGIGRRLAARFRAEGVHTALALARLSDDDVRRIGSVTALRTAVELRGTPCIDERDYEAAPDSITCSRSFGEPVSTEEALSESIAAFTSRAAAKLRRHGLLAGGVNVFAQYGGALDGSWASCTVAFPHPTDATCEMLAEIRRSMKSIFSPGLSYRKSGVMFFGLERIGAPHQDGLFGDADRTAERPEVAGLYRALDALNRRYGASTVVSAAEGVGPERKWKVRRGMLSRRATTNWKELIVVR